MVDIRIKISCESLFYLRKCIKREKKDFFLNGLLINCPVFEKKRYKSFLEYFFKSSKNRNSLKLKLLTLLYKNVPTVQKFPNFQKCKFWKPYGNFIVVKIVRIPTKVFFFLFSSVFQYFVIKLWRVSRPRGKKNISSILSFSWFFVIFDD